jgi:hypothetical protein
VNPSAPATSFKCLGRGKLPTTSHWRSFGPRLHNTVRCRKQPPRGYWVMGADHGKASAIPPMRDDYKQTEFLI